MVSDDNAIDRGGVFHCIHLSSLSSDFCIYLVENVQEILIRDTVFIKMCNSSKLCIVDINVVDICFL